MSIKRGKWERGRPPRPDELPAPPPEKVLGDAQQGVDINRGSSDQVPLSNVGKEQAAELGEQAAAKGGFDSVTTDDALRTRQTAEEIASKSPAPVSVSHGLG